MTSIIETNMLTKIYGSHTVVNKINLSVPEGSIYGFIGPNGAGKSTTMKLLLGLLHPSAGSVRLLDKDLTQENRLSLLRQTGSFIESPSCYGHLTAQENLQIICDLKDVPYSDIDRVLDIVRLEHARKQKVSQFSLGMRQRLGIAQALLGSPKLLILDEPTNGLDPAGIQEMRSLIREMPQLCGATVFISSHLLSELEQIIDHVGIINDGKLLFQGELSALQRHSRGDYVLRVLQPNKACETLLTQGVTVRADGNELHIPPMREDTLAALVQELATHDAGIVGLTQQTKSLEDIFLSLTNQKEAS
ncbi:MAG: ABC transporter ATP-binding protein [Eubacteriales bacterium]|nr:ABC transporter ATP-binding protein [Eubacteriales bacterium]